MAKAKKKETLTPEERLQATLVPESEQPYKVPENWCWTRLGAITEIVGGGTPSSSISEYYCEGTISWICPADLSGYMDIYISRGSKNITELGLEKSSTKILPTNTVCLSSRAPIGYVAIAENPLCTNQGFKSFLPSSCYLPRYLYWYLKGNKQLLERYASGTTFLELSASKAGLVEFPLPPLPEQQRIVDRIESLFAKLDEAKQKAQDTLSSFETRKAAVLHKAFTGELTAQWRKEHDVGMESWTEKILQDVCIMKITDGTHKTPTYCEREEGFPFISSKDVTTENICWDNIKYIVPSLHEELYARLSPQKNDILLAKNGTTGVAAIVEDDRVFDIYVTIAVLRPNTQLINPRYLWRILNSPICKNQFNEHLTGIGVPNLHLRDIKEVVIKVPNIIDEQTEIVRILDELLAKEQQGKEAAEAVLEQIDLIKKSILARAFRGELGTNDPAEESAVELLKAIVISGD